MVEVRRNTACCIRDGRKAVDSRIESRWPVVETRQRRNGIRTRSHSMLCQCNRIPLRRRTNMRNHMKSRRFCRKPGIEYCHPLCDSKRKPLSRCATDKCTRNPISHKRSGLLWDHGKIDISSRVKRRMWCGQQTAQLQVHSQSYFRIKGQIRLQDGRQLQRGCERCRPIPLATHRLETGIRFGELQANCHDVRLLAFAPVAVGCRDDSAIFLQ